MRNFNYYKLELDRIQLTIYGPSIQVYDGEGKKTKNMDLTLDSIPEIRKFLDRIESELKEKEKTL